MWRRVVHTKGVNRGRSCAQTSNRRRILMGANNSNNVSIFRRTLSSAQPSSWKESSPFTLSVEPALKQVPNPTAERVVMKTFLNTLKLNSVGTVDSSHDANEKYTHEEDVNCTAEFGHQENTSALQVIQTEISSALVAVSSVGSVGAQEKSIDTDEATTEMSATNTATTTTNETNIKRPRHASHQRFLRAMFKTQNLEHAKSAYRACLQHDQHIKASHLITLFEAVVPTDPILGLSILKEYKKVAGGKPANANMYVELCKSIGRIEWHIAKTGNFTRLCNDVREELVGLDEYYRQKCFPFLLTSLLAQPMPRIGRMARGLFAHMQEHDYPLSTGTMSHILRLSKYTRQDDLSFPTILARLVEQGHRPAPNVAIQVLQNLFPYTLIDETIVALKAIVQLQSSWEPGALHPTYKVDIGILEHVMAAAARRGAFELNILVWDLVDLLGYEPTEPMYENTIQGFAMGALQDHNVFGVLSEMEERDFVPSRALIRSISRSIRFSNGRVDNAHRILESSSDAQDGGARVTLASINAVLSAAAEKPDVNRAFTIFEEFDLHGIEPNYDSYSFLLESLSKDFIPKREGYQERMLHAPERLDAAAAILSLMEERNIPRCQHCVEQYTQILFNVGRLDAATEFLLDSLERGDPVNNRVIINMSKNNAVAGNIEVARLMAAKTSEPFAHLTHKINEIEKRLLSTQKASSSVNEETDEYGNENIHEE